MYIMTNKEILSELARELEIPEDQLAKEFSKKQLREKFDKLIEQGAEKMRQAQKGVSFRKNI